MNSKKKVAETIQQTREWARAEYKEKTKELRFTKDFQTRQEALMHDPLATVGERVMAWILRRSWGEFVLYAIKNDGEPAYQRDCAKELGISKKRVSAAVSYYQKRGYLENRPKMLYPIISPALTAPQKVTDSPDFLQFMEEWKVTYSSDYEEEKVLCSRLKTIRKVRLSLYKKSRKQARKTDESGSASLLEKGSKTVQRIFETEPSSSSAFSVSPLEVQKAEEDEKTFYERFKARYPAKRFDEGKAKPSFEGRTLTQQSHILERLEVYLSCPHWKNEGGKYIPFAAKWLEECDADPQPAFSLKKEPAKKGFAESVKEEAQRRLNKFGRI